MNRRHDRQIKPLLQAVEQIVLSETWPAGKSITEFELIRRLQSVDYGLLTEDALHDTLDLFQTHFLLFHCLYRLRQRWHKEGVGDLLISALRIGWQPLAVADSDTELAMNDPLAHYYLDINQLQATDRTAVEDLLGTFWRRFDGLTEPPDPAQQAQALAVMELAALPADSQALRRQYRVRLHRCHPDKGGTEDDVRQLNRAYQILCQSLEQQ